MMFMNVSFGVSVWTPFSAYCFGCCPFQCPRER